MTPVHKGPEATLDLQEVLNRYISTKEGRKLSILRYKRLSLSLEGYSYKAIARMEGKTHQAVGASVKRDVRKLMEFAKLNDKRILKNKD